MNRSLIVPDWPAPGNVKALVTTRAGGVSAAPYDSLNLGAHVGDDVVAVAENRARLSRLLPSEPVWLEQVHGTCVIDLDNHPSELWGDAALTRIERRVCAVMTADCLPVLFCDDAGTVVAAAHAGWRGLVSGVLEATVASMKVRPDCVLAWLGPAIGPAAFEVGDEVRDAFLMHDRGAAEAFINNGQPGKWLADLYMLARRRLVRAGVARIYGGGLCTWSDHERFYSYRRDGLTGRFASLVWLGEGGR
ncbi:MAG: peptidoglycan editing factor PgeF [Azoarcus sp.]|jgi:YfiH family protein|nr:peptidoglycan editing factor PgeF [Azoarcus sp.]